MRFDIITIFPRMFEGVFSGGVIGKAREKDLIEIHIHDLRTFATGKHRQVDDRPFGGKQGMVLKPDPIFAAVEAVRITKESPVVLLSPQGRRFDSRLAKEFAAVSQICIICGRYEGVDERVNAFLATHELSIGDYVLSGGEPAAIVIVDSVSRFIPSVVGKIESVQEDSFFDGLLNHPQYTRPRDFRSMKVPEILFSGNHHKIESWRKKKALEKTTRMRPDLVGPSRISPGKKRKLDEKLRERKG